MLEEIIAYWLTQMEREKAKRKRFCDAYACLAVVSPPDGEWEKDTYCLIHRPFRFPIKWIKLPKKKKKKDK